MPWASARPTRWYLKIGSICSRHFYLFAPFEHMHADGSYYIMAVAVYPEFQGSGIGRALIGGAATFC